MHIFDQQTGNTKSTRKMQRRDLGLGHAMLFKVGLLATIFGAGLGLVALGTFVLAVAVENVESGLSFVSWLTGFSAILLATGVSALRGSSLICKIVCIAVIVVAIVGPAYGLLIGSGEFNTKGVVFLAMIIACFAALYKSLPTKDSLAAERSGSFEAMPQS